jgi:hypothetical protein
MMQSLAPNNQPILKMPIESSLTGCQDFCQLLATIWHVSAAFCEFHPQPEPRPYERNLC